MLRGSSQQAAYIFRVSFWSLCLVCWLFFAIAALPLLCLGTYFRRRPPQRPDSQKPGKDDAFAIQ